MSTAIQQRRGTAAAAAAANEILLSGQFGVETDTGKVKVGNGTTPWNGLPYVGGTPTAVPLANVVGLADALALLQDKATATTDSELADAVATLNGALTGKQDAATAATDAELAAAIGVINTSLASKQDASLAATDVELAAAVSTINASITNLSGLVATKTELAAAVAGLPVYRGAWAASTAYRAGQLVTNPAGQIVSAKADFTSGSSYVKANWNDADIDTFRGAFAPNTDYLAGEVVTQAGALYQALVDFTSGASFVGTDWSALSGVTPAGLYRGAWAASTAYKANDTVIEPNGGTLVSRVSAGTSGSSYDAASWARVGSGVFRGAWTASGQVLAVGDLVVNAGVTYYVTTAHTTGSTFLSQNFTALPAAATPTADVLIPTTGWTPTTGDTLAKANFTLNPKTARPIRYRPTKRFMLDDVAKATVAGTGASATIITDGPAPATTRMVASGSNDATYRYDLTADPFDLTAGFIRMPVRLINRTNIQFLHVRVATTPAEIAAGNYHLVSIAASNEGVLASDFFLGWSADKADMSTVGTGASNLASIGAVQFRLRGTHSIDVPWIDYHPYTLAKAKCVLWVDDGGSSGWTDLAPITAKYGFPVTMAPNIGGLDVGDSTQATIAQLRHLQRFHGWQIASHSLTGTEHNTPSTGDTLTQSLGRVRGVQAATGLTGGDDFAWYGNLSSIEDNYLRIRRMFRSGRLFTLTPRQIETMPPSDPWRMRGWGIGASDTVANLTAFVDKARACSGIAQFTFHNNVVSTAEKNVIIGLLDYLAANKATIDVVTIGEALDALPA